MDHAIPEASGLSISPQLSYIRAANINCALSGGVLFCFVKHRNINNLENV